MDPAHNFITGRTIPVDFRIAQLKRLGAAVKQYEPQIHEALRSDLAAGVA